MESQKRDLIQRFIVRCCHLTALLAPAGWVHLTLLTRNTFRPNTFSGGDFVICTTAALLPLLCHLLVWYLQKRWGGTHTRSWLLSAAVFTLSGAAWIYTCAHSFPAWKTALDTTQIALTQYRRLHLTCIIGLLCALISLIPPVMICRKPSKP